MNDILIAWFITSGISTIIYGTISCLMIYFFRKKLHNAELEHDALMWCVEETLELQGHKLIRVTDLPHQQLANEGKIAVRDVIIGPTMKVLRVDSIGLDRESGLMVVEYLQSDAEEDIPKGWDQEKEDYLGEGARDEVERNGTGTWNGRARSRGCELGSGVNGERPPQLASAENKLGA